MIHFCAVNVGPGFGKEYVERLYRGIERNYPGDWDFTVFCDHIDNAPFRDGLDFFIAGDRVLPRVSPKDTKNYWWWAKLNIFREDIWPRGDKVVYFDLDTVIRGDISGFREMPQFSMLHWRGKWYPFGSGVMVFKAGFLPSLFREWSPDLSECYPKGDQQYIVENIKTNICAIPETLVASYKKHDWSQVPVVAFHGKPRPHQLPDDHELKKAWMQ